MTVSSISKVQIVSELFESLQALIVDKLEALEPSTKFSHEHIQDSVRGTSHPCILADGKVFEKAAVLFTYAKGEKLPQAATVSRPHLADQPFAATAISVIVHPRNPHVPTTHMNLRFFVIQNTNSVWHFGGGFDLTPHIVYEHDAKLWHQHAQEACWSNSQYREFKRNCDEYFYLPHRQESRGIGGLFFDDLNSKSFDQCKNLCASVGNHFISAYETIVARRKDITWTTEEEEWMLIRRGRYAEFNLAIDRGTKYGIQSGRRIESVLASLPPRAQWVYGHKPSENTEMSKALKYFKPNVDWISNVDNLVDK